jgi:DNA-binding transcriptional MerR regulator
MLRLLETADVARELGRSTDTVRHLANNGELPMAAITPRGLRLFSPEAVAEAKARRSNARRGSSFSSFSSTSSTS